MVSLNLFLIALLIFLTAFFVASEFAIIRIRSSRVEQLVLEGNKTAPSVQKVLSNLDGYLSACQLGITVTALGLGWLGESTFEKILHPVFHAIGVPDAFSEILTIVLAFSIVTFLHVVIGELAPKTLAIQKAERVTLLVAKPLIFFYKLMFPFIWALNGSALFIVRMFGLKASKEHAEVHTEEELQILLSESFQKGEINQSEYKYVSNIFEFDERTAREIMVPRVDMVVLNIDASFEENYKIIKTEQFTRFPVISESKDEILGMIHSKEFFLQLHENPELDMKTLIRPVIEVIESVPIKTVLTRMQKEGNPFAILKDEYGGTSGLITMEDIVEEIIGDIRDEFDTDEQPEIVVVSQNELVVDGKGLISEVNDLLGTDLNNEDVDTIGGWLSTHNPSLENKMEFIYENLSFTVLDKDSHRYKRIKIKKQED